MAMKWRIYFRDRGGKPGYWDLSDKVQEQAIRDFRLCWPDMEPTEVVALKAVRIPRVGLRYTPVGERTPIDQQGLV